MVKTLYTLTSIIFILLMVNCSSNGIKVLKDKNTYVSKDSLYYLKNYRLIKNVGLPKLIDTNALYIESHYLFGKEKEKFHRTDLYVGIYKFYKSGAVNDFSMPSTNNLDDPKNYNPKYTGEKGICFFENGDWYIDILAKSSELNTIGTYRYLIESISKDTIKLRANSYFF